MREKFAIIFAIVLVCGLCQAQKPKQPSKDEVNEIIRQDLERHRGLVEQWKERWAREMEARKALEFQLTQIRSAVAKAAKL